MRAILTGLVIVVIAAACGDGDATDTISGPGDETTTLATQATISPETESTTTTEGPGGSPPVELAGSAWDVTHHASELFSGITNIWPGSEITLLFGDDGSISGNAGCNDYNGTYQVEGGYITDPDPFSDEVEGQSVSIEVLAVTAVSCDDQDLMDQEAEYLDALGQAEQWSIGQGFGSDSALLLISEDGLLVEGQATD